jgi:hypothetical protein
LTLAKCFVFDDTRVGRRTNAIGVTLSAFTVAGIVAYVTTDEQVSEPTEEIPEKEDNSGIINYASLASDS